VLPAGCTGRQIAAETPADQRHPLRVHLRAGERVVDHRAHHVLPVGAEHQALVDEGAALAGAVEGEAVVAAAHGGHGMGKVRLMHGGVVAVGGDHRGARLARVIGTVEVAGQARALVGDFHGLHGWRHSGGGSGERLGLPVEGRHQPCVRRRTEQRQIGRAVVVAGPQPGLAGTRRAAGRCTGFGDLNHTVGGGGPGPIPAVRIRGRDLRSRDEALAEISTPIERVRQGPDGKPLKKRVLKEEAHRDGLRRPRGATRHGLHHYRGVRRQTSPVQDKPDLSAMATLKAGGSAG